MMPLKTTDLIQGDNVQLLGFGETDITYRRRLFAFGLTRGVTAHVVRRAPLGCPIQLNIRGTDVMLRAAEASHLLWERV
jgi:ferrous iron transport protein A